MAGISPLCEVERDIKIMEQYDTGRPIKKICEEFGISENKLYRILQSSFIADQREKKADALEQSLIAAYEKNGKRFESLFNKYLEECIDEERIKKTSLVGLMTTYGIALDKYVKLEELKLKKEEMKLKKEAITGGSGAAGALIFDFTKAIQSANSLTTPHQEPEELEKDGEL